MNRLLKKEFIIISIGAIPAAILRWQVDNILIVNIIGCFLIGFINYLHISKRLKLILVFGFCGSLTTFSGFSLQLFQLLSYGLYNLFFLNSIIIVIISILTVALGHWFAQKIIN